MIDGITPDEEKKLRQMVSFVEDGEYYQKSPIGYIERDINGPDRFAILKTTDNGKWMRGNMLYYRLNGIEIYTEENNVIFVDLKQNTLWIKEYSKVIEEINPTNPEDKEYIILYRDLGYQDDDGITLDSTEFPLRWEQVVGRLNVYENIKVNAPVIDIDKSYVLVETVPFKDAMTIRQFMDWIKNTGILENPEEFDINDYAGNYL